MEVGWGPDCVAVGQSAGLTGVKLAAATPTVEPEDEEPPDDGGAAVTLDGAALVEVAVFFVEVGVSFVVEAAVVWVEEALEEEEAASAALLEAAFLHDLRPSDALGTAGTLTGWGPRGLSWRRRMPAW